jgi:hypothetical protein
MAWKCLPVSSRSLPAVNSIHVRSISTRTASSERATVRRLSQHRQTQDCATAKLGRFYTATHRCRRVGAAMKSQLLPGLAAFAATLAACSVTPPMPPSREVHIANFKQGLIRQDAGGKWQIYNAGNQFPYAVNGGCIVNHAQHQCMWSGFEFEFTAPDAQTELSCMTQKGSGSLEANPNFIYGNSSKSVRWSITLNGHTGRYQDPQYIIMPKAPRENRTDSTTCTFEGKTALDFTFTILAERPTAGTTP